MQGMTNNVEKRNGPAGYSGATGNTSLTQEFIDMFELKNGKLPKEDPEYDPQKPWENRCERFKASVLYNGSYWWDREVETFVGGKDYTALNSTAKGVSPVILYENIWIRRFVFLALRKTHFMIFLYYVMQRFC